MKILFVDAGNYCRSPAAEVVCRTMSVQAGAAGQVRFSSAGLKDKHVGDTADPRTIAACSARGYDLGEFRCREISAADFASSDLILAMDHDNVTQREQTMIVRLGYVLGAVVGLIAFGLNQALR